MRLAWDERAWDEYCYWQKQDKKTLRRINELIKSIRRTPYEGIGRQARALERESAGLVEPKD